MRVLHVIPSNSPARGGPTQALRSYVSALAELGVEVDVATTDDDGAGVRAVPIGNELREYGAGFRYFRRRTRFYTCAPGLAQWVSRAVSGYDVVHVHALFSFPSIAAARAARANRVPYLIRPLGTLNRYGMQHRRWMKRLSFGLIERRLIEGAAAVHFTSDPERSDAEALGVAFRSVVIPNIVPAPDTFERRPDPYRLFFLSRIDPVKGLESLIEAMPEIRRAEPRATLRIAGEGDPAYVASLKGLAESVGVSKALEWTGFAAGEDKRRAFAEASVFVLPSRSENFGIAAAEAMGHGVPVVVSRNVPMHGEIAQSGAGLAATGTKELAAAVLRLLGDSAMRERMGERGRELIRERYSAPAVGRQLVRTYEEVLV